MLGSQRQKVMDSDSTSFVLGNPELWSWSPKVKQLELESYGVGVKELWNWSPRGMELESNWCFKFVVHLVVQASGPFGGQLGEPLGGPIG